MAVKTKVGRNEGRRGWTKMMEIIEIQRRKWLKINDKERKQKKRSQLREVVESCFPECQGGGDEQRLLYILNDAKDKVSLH